MPPEDVYADIVHLYDLEHADFTDDVDLLLELADIGEGPILELGCGTGRILLPLAKAGHQVAGIDSSGPMLAIARERLADHNVTLIKGDMAELERIGGAPYGMIIASLNSIMHLENPDQQRAMIRSAWGALKPGGRLVIDTLNPSLGQLNHLLNATHLEGSWSDPAGSTIDKWGHRQPGEESQVIDTLIWYDQLSTSGEFSRIRTRFNLRYVHQSELALLLDAAGFYQVDWYGSYELDPWHPESDRIIAVAHKDE